MRVVSRCDIIMISHQQFVGRCVGHSNCPSPNGPLYGPYLSGQNIDPIFRALTISCVVLSSWSLTWQCRVLMLILCSKVLMPVSFSLLRPIVRMMKTLEQPRKHIGCWTLLLQHWSEDQLYSRNDWR
jgi:hypothetical protein